MGVRGGDTAMPGSLFRLKDLKKLDIFNNPTTTSVHDHFEQASEQVYKVEISPAPGTPPASPSETSTTHRDPTIFVVIFILLAFFLVFIFLASKRTSKRTEEKKIAKNFQDSPVELVVVEDYGNLGVEKSATLVFFGEENERFKIGDLLSSEAVLQGHNFYSSLYKVTLNSNAVFALVACHASEDEQLLIYRFQTGNLSNLLSSYAGGSRVFPWKLRLSVAHGVAKGLQYIAKESCNRNMPHGNLKPSNILLNEFEEPQISEYGVQCLIDPKWEMLYTYNGYKAPEKNLTEKSDIFSFGVILLELLTGRAVENSSIDLPKWVKAKIREEWTGEVFDTEVNRTAGHWAFPLLNIALQCVSHVPEQRPTTSDILEKIENMIKEQDDCSFSSTSSVESGKHDHQSNYMV